MDERSFLGTLRRFTELYQIKFTCCICGIGNNITATRKIEKAKKFGVRILTESEFANMLTENE